MGRAGGEVEARFEANSAQPEPADQPLAPPLDLRLAGLQAPPTVAGGESFDGWIVLPVLGASSAFAVVGSGFEPRARLQIRASAYFVA